MILMTIHYKNKVYLLQVKKTGCFLDYNTGNDWRK